MSDKITPYIYQLAEYFQVPFADYDVLFIYAFFYLDNNILHNLCQYFYRGETD